VIQQVAGKLTGKEKAVIPRAGKPALRRMATGLPNEEPDEVAGGGRLEAMR
jgi:hypothetical protein